MDTMSFEDKSVSNNFDIPRIKMSSERTLISGDKIASRTAQMGTIGRIMDAADFPFPDGHKLEIIINMANIR